MVKRPKSPEIVEDARFFTVYQPYPLNPDWHEESDQIEAAKWVGECIGPNHLWAIHEKPRAGNMILLEVSKDFADHGLLLGEHRWAEFLRSPTKEELPRVTQVFHSFYARGRDAQKDGWKVIPVNSRWLHNWVPGKGKIIHPYPETHWCTPPVEDRTNKTLCRPLPTRSLPVEPPSRPPAPVVGSSTWVAKQTDASPTIKPSALSAKPTAGTLDTKKASQFVERDRNAPSPMSPQSNVNAGRTENPSLSTVNLTPLNGKNAWGKPVPLKKFVADAAKANAVKGKSSWAPTPDPPSGAKSPLVEQSPTGPVNAWANPLKVLPALRAKPSTPTTPSTRSQSPWSALETTKESCSWITQDMYEKKEDEVKNSNAHGSGMHPSSPRNGRSGDLPYEREQEASRHESSSRTRTDHGKLKENEYDTVDFVTPQREKQPTWGVPSPEPTVKKARDKGKKKLKDTATGWGPEPENKDQTKKGDGEKMGFEATDEVADSSANKDKADKKETFMAIAAPFDWASEPLDDPGYEEEVFQLGGRPLQTPNVQSMDVDTRVDYGERSSVPTNEKKDRSPPRQPKSWGKTGRPESPYKGKKFDGGSPRDNEFNSGDGPRSRRLPGSPIKLKDLPPGRSDGQGDHSDFADLDPKKKKSDKPTETLDTFKDRFDKPRDKFKNPKDKYDKPQGRYDDKPRDKYDDKPKDRSEKPRDEFDKSRDRIDKGKGKLDKPSDKKPTTSSAKDTKGKGKNADQNMESRDFGDDKDATIEIDDELKADWGEWGSPPSDTMEEKSKPGPSRYTPNNKTMDLGAPEESVWGEWGPPPPSSKKGSSSAMDVDTPETDWGEWGPPPPAHLKKNVQSKVFRTDDAPPKPAPKKGKKFESDKPKPGYKDSTRESWRHTKDSAVNSKAPETTWGKWESPADSKKGSTSKDLRSETPKATPKNAAMEVDVPETGRGEWGGPLPHSKIELKAETSGGDDYAEWGHAPHKTKAGAKSGDTGDWGARSASAPTESKKLPEKKPDDDNGFKAEAWGMGPVLEEFGSSDAQDDFGTRAEDWGLGPVPLGPGDDVDESEFHPWEKNTSIDSSPLESTWKRDANYHPTRPRGSKRGPRVRKKKEPPSIGRLRGFEDVDQQEFEEQDHAAEKTNEGETSATAGRREDWQVPIVGKREDWGVR